MVDVVDAGECGKYGRYGRYSIVINRIRYQRYKPHLFTEYIIKWLYQVVNGQQYFDIGRLALD